MGNVYGLQFAVVPIDNEALKATPVPAAPVFPVFGAPSTPNVRVEVVSVSIAGAVLVVDAADPVTINLVYHDASGDADTTLLTGAAGAVGDLKAAGGLTANELLTIWRGNQSLDPGDTIRAPLTTTTPTTAGDGYYFLVGYRIKEYSGE